MPEANLAWRDTVLVLFDAQTSGGLLIAVEEARTAELVAGLTERHTPAASVVGRIVDEPVGRITVRRSP